MKLSKSQTQSALFALCLLSPAVLACDTSHLSLTGSATVQTCSPQSSSNCVYAGKAVYEYLEAVPDPDSVFTIGLQSSPWRMYDGEMRILTVEDVADVIRPEIGKL